MTDKDIKHKIDRFLSGDLFSKEDTDALFGDDLDNDEIFNNSEGPFKLDLFDEYDNDDHENDSQKTNRLKP